MAVMTSSAQRNVAEIANLSVEFDRDGRPFRAVSGVSMSIADGEIVALVGESGSGKTVLGRCLLGLTPALRGCRVSGQVSVRGIDMVGGPSADRRWARRHLLGAVFQDPLTALDPTMKVGDQVCERGVSKLRGLQALEECGVPEPTVRFGQWPHQLSGGLRQRAMIAGAISAPTGERTRGQASTGVSGVPALIVADEPTTALDVRVQSQVIELLTRLRDDHACSILLITHDLGVAAQIADRIVVMSQGEIAETGSTHSVIRKPESAYTRMLLESRMDVADPLPVDLAATDETGNELTTTGEGPALVLEGIVKEFPQRGRRTSSRQVLHDVDLTIRKGEVVALVGESGSGKTTLLRIVAGLERATAGAVTLAAGSNRPRMIFQDARSSLTPWLTVREQIEEQLDRDMLDRAARAVRVNEILGRVGLDARMAGSRPRELSGGQCQRAAIARALCGEPDLLLCDEPVSALDARLASSVITLLNELRRDLGVAMLFVTHDLAVAKHVATRIAVMSGGRIVEDGPVERIFDAPEHDYTRELLRVSPTLAHLR